MVLLIVINYEQPQNQQTAQNAADSLAHRMNVPMRARQRGQKQKRGGNNAPPAFRGKILRISFGGDNQFMAGSHGKWVCVRGVYRFEIAFVTENSSEVANCVPALDLRMDSLPSVFRFQSTVSGARVPRRTGFEAELPLQMEFGSFAEQLNQVFIHEKIIVRNIERNNRGKIGMLAKRVLNS